MSSVSSYSTITCFFNLNRVEKPWCSRIHHLACHGSWSQNRQACPHLMTNSLQLCHCFLELLVHLFGQGSSILILPLHSTRGNTRRNAQMEGMHLKTNTKIGGKSVTHSIDLTALQNGIELPSCSLDVTYCLACQLSRCSPNQNYVFWTCHNHHFAFQAIIFHHLKFPSFQEP